MALLVKPEVDFGPSLAPAGARILDVLKTLAPSYDFDITITSARDGAHSGPADPHHTGEAFDIRSNGLADSQIRRLLADVQRLLYTSTPRRFYAFYEAPGTPNAHLHIQRRAGSSYTVTDYLANL
jgi:hypothetical protein